MKEGVLKSAIEADFGDVDTMKKELSGMTVAVQGSGWGWLGYNTKTGKIFPHSSVPLFDFSRCAILTFIRHHKRSCLSSGKIECATRFNQDPLEATTGLKPLLGIDVWEHGKEYFDLFGKLLFTLGSSHNVFS